MQEAEAHAVAQLIADADGGIFAVPSLIRRAADLLPGWDWEQLVADVDPTVAGPADLSRLGEHKEDLRELARAHKITNLRWDPAERRLVATYGTTSFSDELAFEVAAADLVGRAVPIISDNTDSTRDGRGHEPF